MSIRDRKDFWSGVMFVLFGILFVVWSREYQFGTSQRMGPGYFPTVLGILLIALGILVALPTIRANAPKTEIGNIGWRGLLIVLGSVALYAYLLPWLGFVISMVLLVVISATASNEFRPKETLISVVVLGVASYFVFVKGLSLQFPVWPVFLTN